MENLSGAKMNESDLLQPQFLLCTREKATPILHLEIYHTFEKMNPKMMEDESFLSANMHRYTSL